MTQHSTIDPTDTVQRPWASLLAQVLIGLLCLLGYSNSWDVPFIRDDILRIVNDPAIKEWPACLMHTARPLVNLSLFVNYQVGEFNVAGYHLFNLLVHIGAALLLFQVVHTTVRLASRNASFPCSPLAMAFPVAALWAVHPVQTESVTYLIQRAESMVTLFFLGTLYTFARSLASSRPRRWLVASVVAGLLAMATKPVAATLPLVVILYDRAYGSGSFRKSLRLRRHYYLLLAAGWLLLVGLLMQSTESFASAGFTAKLISPWSYLITQAGVVLHYFKLIAWPFDLCFDYAWPAATGLKTVLPTFLLLLLAVAGTCVLYARWPKLGFSPLLFLVVLFPTSSFMPTAHYAVEHRLYLPMAGMIAFYASLIAWGASGLPAGRWRKGVHGIMTGLVAMALLTLTTLTFQRNEDYRSPERLWRSVLTTRPDNTQARVALAGELLKRSKYDAAIMHCTNVLDRLSFLSTMNAEALDRAVTEPRGYEVLDKAHQYVDALNCLGYAHLKKDRLPEAETRLKNALRLMPRSLTARLNLITIYGRRREYDKAAREWQQVLRFYPDSAAAHEGLGRIYLAQGKTTEAIAHFQQALQIDPRRKVSRRALKSLPRTTSP